MNVTLDMEFLDQRLHTFVVLIDIPNHLLEIYLLIFSSPVYESPYQYQTLVSANICPSGE